MLLRRYHNVKKESTEEKVNSSLKQETSPNLEKLTVKELRDLCKERGIKGYSNKSEEELIEMLSGGVVNVESDK